MKRASMIFLFAALVTMVAFVGCSTMKADVDEGKALEKDIAKEKKKEEPKEDLVAKRKSLERKLMIAEMKLKHTMAEQETKEKASKESVEYAKKELEFAQAKFTQFKDFDAPRRIADAELSIRFAKDSAVDADEELKQLEIMYKDADLEDMTAEFVINRGKRNAERRKQALAIQVKALQALTGHTIPRETAAKELEVKKLVNALKNSELKARSGRMQGEIALLNAETEIENLKDELAKLDKKEKEKEETPK